ncbi:hypothetical protein QAD02_013026 [Eretmocerus hayati]|uniref:Uncharacterized protein n=1 Tax=Eretmocerus hayati TaxID=131215 RepID=A0ACC2P3X7_9HYME|nr:hypothetical protein QAD02_013026 [Eretmocerus hayati]
MDQRARGLKKASNIGLYHLKTQRRFQDRLEEGRKCLEEIKTHHRSPFEKHSAVGEFPRIGHQDHETRTTRGSHREGGDVNCVTSIFACSTAGFDQGNAKDTSDTEIYDSRGFDPRNEAGLALFNYYSSANSSCVENERESSNKVHDLKNTPSSSKRTIQAMRQLNSDEAIEEDLESPKRKRFKNNSCEKNEVGHRSDRLNDGNKSRGSTGGEVISSSKTLLKKSHSGDTHDSSFSQPIRKRKRIVEVDEIDDVEGVCSSDDELDYEEMKDFLDSTRGRSKKFTDLLNIVMFPASNMTVEDISNMVQAIYLRHKISKAARNAFLELIKTIAGPEYKHISISEYYVSKFSKPKNDNKTYKFYCSECFKTISEPLLKANIRKSSPGKCDSCEKGCNLSTKNNNFYINMDVEYQLRTLLENQDILNSLLDSVGNIKERNNKISDYITDVHDGEIY